MTPISTVKAEVSITSNAKHQKTTWDGKRVTHESSTGKRPSYVIVNGKRFYLWS